MKRIAIVLLTLIPLFASHSCKKEDITGKNLRLICEELKPYSYVENDQLTGISADIVAQVAAQMGLQDLTFEVTDNWTIAMDLLETSDNVALFTTGITADRKDKFKWVGPITMFSTGFVGLESANLMITSVADAKALPSVGVVEGYATVGMLQNEGFQNVQTYSSLGQAINALYNGSVNAVFDITNSIIMTASSESHDPEELENLFTYSTTQGFIAFSKAVSDKLIESWQEKLDMLKEQGWVQDVYDEYLPGSKAPGILNIFTEENPPQSFKLADGSLTGSSVEMVRAMMQAISVNESITSTVWSDALNQILIAPNSMTFSTLRSAEREDLFHWVGPVCKKSYCFFVKADGDIQLNAIADAKALSAVGVPTGWASQQELINQGFTNILTWTTPAEVFSKLMDGTIDAAVLNDIAIPTLAEQTGYNVSDVRMALVLSAGETYLAFSLDTKAAYIQQWQTAYTTIKNNGKFDEIWHKWYPNIDW